jgi:hypothetical protein
MKPKKMLDLDAILDPDRPIRPKLGSHSSCAHGEPDGATKTDLPDRSQPQVEPLPVTRIPGRADEIPFVRPCVTVHPSGLEWDKEARKLIDFFRSARPLLPQTPFWLAPWEYISNPEKWYRGLELDIAAGPRGCRARMGVLQEDLRRLSDFLSAIEHT